MMRSLTKAQIERQAALLARLGTVKTATASELRAFLARYHSIFITEDTVQRDLRAMAAVGTVCSDRRRYYGGKEWRLGRGQD